MKGEKCLGGKQRITVLVCANMSGFLLLVNLLSLDAARMEEVSLSSMKLTERHGWWISDLFSSWLLKLDKRFQMEEEGINGSRQLPS